jgi:hypothetical protein
VRGSLELGDCAVNRAFDVRVVVAAERQADADESPIAEIAARSIGSVCGLSLRVCSRLFFILRRGDGGGGRRE